MSELKVIYLGPACQEQADGREWCKDDVWDRCECGDQSVRYVIGTEFDRVTAERDALQERLNAADQRADDLQTQLASTEQSRRAWFDSSQAADKRIDGLTGASSRAAADIVVERQPDHPPHPHGYTQNLMREEFEEWAAEEAEIRGVGETIGLMLDEHHDRYSMIWTQTAWMAWQASRFGLQATTARLNGELQAATDLITAKRSVNRTLRSEIERLKAGQGEPVALAVWYGAMPESNGKTNWTAILHRKGDPIYEGCCITLDRSEYPDRVRYEADRVRYLIGDLEQEPFILDYDANKHSGYTSQPAPVSKQEAATLIASYLAAGRSEGHVGEVARAIIALAGGPVAVVDERAEFVAWVRREWPKAPLSNVRDLLPKNDPRYGEYCDETLQRAWVGWQARAALLNPK